MENIISFFLPKETNDSGEAALIHRGRYMVLSGIIMAIAGIVTVPVLYLFQADLLYNTVYVLSGMSIGLLFFIKWTGNLPLASYLFASIGAVFFFLTIYYTGGIHSSFIIWVASLPIIAIILDNKMLGFTLGLSLFIFIYFGWREWSGIELSNDISPEIIAYYDLFNQLTFMVVTVLIIRFYFKKNKSYNQELEVSNQDLERFAYMASHDLKVPLRNIVSFSQLLRRRIKNKIEPSEEEYLDFITNNAHQMTELIQGILDLSRLEKAENIELEEVDLNELIQEVHSNLQDKIEKKKGVLTYLDLPKVKANSSQIKQLFQNIIENALKYNRNETPTINISAKKEKKIAHIYFKDNGIGIEPAYFDKVFEMFKRLHSSAEFQGTGIGLALCKKIAHRNGGDLTIESSSDSGTIFKLSLPLS